MFRRHQKNDLPYYIGLVFLVFPILGTAVNYYPMWTLILTAGFTAAYLLLVRLKASYHRVIAVLWFYTLAYINVAKYSVLNEKRRCVVIHDAPSFFSLT